MAPGNSDPVFVLVHSPLVGPTTWRPVADELERRARGLVLPMPVAEARAYVEAEGSDAA